jgi:hypothetical protein
MNPDEREVFECLEDEVNIFNDAYETLPDNFMELLNGGVIEDKPQLNFEEVEENKALLRIEDTEEEGPMGGHAMMIANYKEKVADVVAMLDK